MSADLRRAARQTGLAWCLLCAIGSTLGATWGLIGWLSRENDQQ